MQGYIKFIFPIACLKKSRKMQSRENKYTDKYKLALYYSIETL